MNRMPCNGQNIDADTPNRKTCLECSAYLPASNDEATEFGICLNQDAFEPFVEELLNGPIPDSCRALVEQMKFEGETHLICANFQQIESIEIEDSTFLGQRLRDLAEKGKLTPEAVEAAIFEDRVMHIDWKTQPVDQYTCQLERGIPEERDKAISSLGALIALENLEAFQALLRFLASLPPPTTLSEVHLKSRILHQLGFVKSKEAVVPYLLEELGRTKSDNTTRQWILEILRFLERCPLQVIKDPLEQMLADGRFSFKLKRRVLNLISDSSSEI